TIFRSKSISLQASASDDEGNEISQEIIEAYKLTKSGAADMQSLLADLEEKGDAKSEATRTLNMHLTTLKLFEEKGEAEKVIKHLNGDRKSTRLNSSHVSSSYAVFCLKKKIWTQMRRK